MSNHWIKCCLCCGSEKLTSVLDLGMQPPANSYSEDADTVVTRHPLGLNVCMDCWHSQLSYCVDRHEIFDRYAYVSGTSRTLAEFFAWFASALAKALPESSRVLELAANDGSLIREMQKNGLTCVGVDPAANIVNVGRANGLPIECGYWPEAAAQVEGKFDVIVCMNVLAHVDNPLAFLQGCTAKLSRDGIVLVQPSQARMFENGEFDTIYHEHISFFNTHSIEQLARRAGLKLVGAVLVKIHGDSPIYFLQHDDLAQTTKAMDYFKRGAFGLDEDLFSYEQTVGLYELATYERFRSRAMSVVDSVKITVESYRAEGYDIVFVGAAAKAMTLLNAGGIRPDMFLDESPHKIGLYAPGCGNRIEALAAGTTGQRPALFVLSAWNFRFELAANLRKLGVPAGSKFYAYFPQPQFI
jgi:2-polyprenyl-3-methyl-5-hydroxy-6-metoxy-1,4-benzoquinol methylase